MGKENSQDCSRPGWRWTCAPRSTPCFWQSDSRHQRTPVVLANSIQVTFWYQRFTLNDCVSISVTFLGAEENAHVGELGYLSLVGSQAWHISDDRHGFKKEMCPTCQGDVSLGGPATLGELGHLLHHLLLWLVLHGSLRFWTFHPVSQFQRLKPFDRRWQSPKVGFLAADLVLDGALWVTQVEGEVRGTSHINQTFSVCGEIEWRRSKKLRTGHPWWSCCSRCSSKRSHRNNLRSRSPNISGHRCSRWRRSWFFGN